jgi:hypothetical protein
MLGSCGYVHLACLEADYIPQSLRRNAHLQKEKKNKCHATGKPRRLPREERR